MNRNIEELIFVNSTKVCPSSHVTLIKAINTPQGRIYISDESLETYKATVNNSTYNKLMRPLSEYPYERFWE